ncbi:heavy-metal-associated domain-containing protein [Mesotoga sp. B105.6.4]|uniref:heavy-metal-associated domain-containing protein n=1 Tax=Mesotoga sp. B105.6.4 TaxID=1582224 RepID=UPI000CCA3F45|nr:heavy metal-associated domain-containing protein [Mesotoga sp. B105.6.4]PNQ05161.1 heavy metal transport/detoxification protein [Mesotoga sp. SC_NapDC3]PNS39255.1 heavy metal transport/detoxification protein [Mesotoga sp. B105.6.4]PXF34256.1 heavy metal transport/detoxification protein [Mesotoga sp. SC_NapDC]RIZ61105.1 heavy metal transport/detoxification protein [Mesotoga sp. SC_NapDC2]
MKLEIGGMSCNHCKMRVERALKSVEGVEDAVVDIDEGIAEIFTTKNIEENRLREIIEDAGYSFMGIRE